MIWNSSNDSDQQPESRVNLSEQVNADNHRRQAEERKRRAANQEAVREYWSGLRAAPLLPLNKHDYLKRKKVKLVSPDHVRPGTDAFNRSMAVEYVDIDRRTMGIEHITLDGTKRLMKGSTRKGSFNPINSLWDVTDRLRSDIERICIAEGIATALSVEMAARHKDTVVLTAGGASNLKSVAALMRKHFPKAQIDVFGDAGNGSESARKAAEAVNGKCFIPTFEKHEEGLSDWNDVFVSRGLDGLRSLVTQSQVASDTTVPQSFEDITADVGLKMDFPPPKYIIDKLLPEGLTLIAGRPKLGKSSWLLNVMMSVAQGGDALGRYEVNTPGRVLYLSFEDGPRLIFNRIELINKTLKLTDEELARIHVVTSSERECVDALRNWLIQYPDTNLICIDTLTAYRRRPKEKGGNPFHEDYDSMEGLHSLTNEREGLSILVSHHDNKMKLEDDNWLDLVTGTRGIAAKPDTVIGMFKAASDDGHCAVLKYVSKMMDRSPDIGIQGNYRDYTWSTYEGDAIDLSYSKARREILDCLRDAGTPLSGREIGRRIGREETVAKNVKKMVDAGILGKEGGGRFTKLFISNDED